MMGSAQHPAGTPRQLILHHLSDLQYEQVEGHRQNDMLVKYQNHLASLPPDRRPDLVVITGNLTTTGKKNDLGAVAAALRMCFSSWAGRLHERVFIVPGPQDVNWEDGATIGLEAFYRDFHEFALPYHTPMPSGQGTPASGQQDFIGYPIDTCYSPNELLASLEDKVGQYSKSYKRFVKRRSKLNTRWMGLWKRTWRPRKQQRERVRKAQLASLRTHFLDLTERGQLVDFRAGRITQPDLEQFDRWATSTIPPAPQGAGAMGPLKVLITHHPLAVHDQRDTATSARRTPQNRFQQVAKAAGKAGFHLALHGHVRNPQLLADALFFEAPDYLQPIRQIGAASLGETGIFNEIIAVAHDGNGETAWQLTLHPVNLKSNDAASDNPLALYNHAETTDKQFSKLKRDATRQREFDRAMRFAMSRFSEQVYQVQSANRQGAPNIPQLPQDTMNLIHDVVRNVIFNGYDARVRLLLKNTEKRGAIPRLVPTYLAPAIMEGPDALIYPASVAAWALILGRTLIYPAITKESTDKSIDVKDHEWLRHTNKIEPLLSFLKELTDEALGRSYGREASVRYRSLHADLEAIRGAATSTSGGAIVGEHIYQPEPIGSPPENHPHFACVPYPMRLNGGTPKALPEIMVLDVSVRPMDQSEGQQITGNSGDTDPFTDERVAMLETLAELIGTILVTASAFGRPPGVWDDRFRS